MPHAIYDYTPTNMVTFRPEELPDGLVFIGDPQVSAKKPRNRVEEGFLDVSLGKLKEAINVANTRNAVPVILGDLFEYPAEGTKYQNNMVLLGVLRILRQAEHMPICLTGNHDKREKELQVDENLYLLHRSLTAMVIYKPGGMEIEMKGNKTIWLGGTPHGYDLPEKIEWPFNSTPACRIWLTHADVAFSDFGNFPGSFKPFEIEGVDMVVNGHLHVPSRSVQAGKTTWHNPGNILRLSLDKTVTTMKPSVSFWAPGTDSSTDNGAGNGTDDTELVRIVIPHEPAEKVFIRNVEDELSSILEIQQGADVSEFVKILRGEDSNLDAPETARGEILKDALRNASKEASEPARKEVFRLYENALEVG